MIYGGTSSVVIKRNGNFLLELSVTGCRIMSQKTTRDDLIKCHHPFSSLFVSVTFRLLYFFSDGVINLRTSDVEMTHTTKLKYKCPVSTIAGSVSGPRDCKIIMIIIIDNDNYQ
jgi:hypothetical protein